MNTITLYRPVGPKELALIEASGWREFPPRLPEQPIFYPVTNEQYTIEIARDWNVKAIGVREWLRRIDGRVAPPQAPLAVAAPVVSPSPKP